ncbi:hypothetical protein A2U01_0065736, partial [Trifolium medium]|nr:hypothetical protein [Trifolium medium]
MQGGIFTPNTQITPDEKNHILKKNEERGECMEEGIEKNEEEIMSEGCGAMKIVEAIETPHKEELPQEWPCTEVANTVDNEEVMMVAEKNEGLF